MLAWRCMFSSGSGWNFAMLGPGCGMEQRDGVSVEEAVAGLDKIEARLGTSGVLRLGSSVSQSRLQWQSNLIGFLDHKAISTAESA